MGFVQLSPFHSVTVAVHLKHFLLSGFWLWRCLEHSCGFARAQLSDANYDCLSEAVWASAEQPKSQLTSQFLKNPGRPHLVFFVNQFSCRNVNHSHRFVSPTSNLLHLTSSQRTLLLFSQWLGLLPAGSARGGDTAVNKNVLYIDSICGDVRFATLSNSNVTAVYWFWTRQLHKRPWRGHNTTRQSVLSHVAYCLSTCWVFFPVVLAANSIFHLLSLGLSINFVWLSSMFLTLVMESDGF